MGAPLPCARPKSSPQVQSRLQEAMIPLLISAVTWKLKSSLSQPCPKLCDPMDCSPPGSSVHGLSQARMLEWVVLPFSMGSSQPRDQTRVSCISRWILYHLSRQGSPVMCNWGKFWTRHKETQSPTATFEELGARAGRRASSCSQHHKRAADHPSHALASSPTRPYPHPASGSSSSLSGREQGNLFLFLHPLLQQGPQ